jgi:LacI family transcriptional regulator
MTKRRRAPGAAGDGPVTVKTVAFRAGVSVATVSRVLGGHADVVTDATRERVIRAVEELGYQPNPLAVALRKGVTKTIGLIVPDIADAYFHQVARGVEDVAQEAGYAVVFCNSDRQVDKETLCLDLLRDKRVDGIIFCGGGVDDERHLQGRSWGAAKVVAIGAHVVDLPSIRVDDSAAIEAAVAHLAAGGRSRVLCIAGEADWLVTQRRLAGYHAGVARLGLVADPALVGFHGFSGADGRRAITEALAAGLEFDAAIAFDDDAALGALAALHAAGRRVPEDVALIGCDDIPFASLVRPTLSTIRFPTYDFGTTAARMVLGMLAGSDVERVVDFPFELCIRESSGGRAADASPDKESPHD